MSRTVLVTGGSGGIGSAICRRFAADGDDVMVADLDPDAAAQVAGECSGRSVALDITSAESIEAGLDAAGPVHVLVNCAGVLHLHGRLVELAPADLQTILAVNVQGTFLMMQATARRWLSAGTPGVVINISSIGGRQPTPGMGGYETSKAAVDALTRWGAAELAEHGIRVNSVAPGPVATAMLNMGMPEGSPARQAWVGRIPLGRIAGVDDVAAATAFLAGPGAAHITGVSLAVDGGQLLR